MPHAQEPWIADPETGAIFDANGEPIATGGEFCVDGIEGWENSRRIVDCVNACIGINPDTIPEMLVVLRDIRDDFDCDADSHKHGTSCRRCDAGKVLEQAGYK